MAVTDAEDAVITEGDPVSISAEILKNPLDAMEGWFAINDPLFTIELVSESFKGLKLFEMVYTVGEYQGARFETFLKKVKELSFEQG